MVDQTNDTAEPTEGKQWYENIWLWVAGGAAALIGGNMLFGGNNSEGEEKSGGIMGWVLGLGAVAAAGWAVWKFGLKDDAAQNRQEAQDAITETAENAMNQLSEWTEQGTNNAQVQWYRMNDALGANRDDAAYQTEYAEALAGVLATAQTTNGQPLAFTQVSDVLGDFDAENVSDALRDAAVDVNEVIQANPTYNTQQIRETLITPAQ